MRVMTYNTLTDGRDMRSDATQSDRWAAIVAVLKAADPDVVMLQEVMTQDFLLFLADQLSMAWYWTDDGGQMQVGALSRLPVALAEAVPLGNYGMAARSALALTVVAPDGGLLTIYGIHAIAFYAWFTEMIRGWQIKRLLRHAQQADPRHLLIGDFNTFAPKDFVSLKGAPHWVKRQTWPQLGLIARWALKPVYQAGYIDSYRYFHPDEHGFTLPSSYPTVRLDYMFAAPDLQSHLSGCEVVQTPDLVKTASDHRPVVLDLGL